MEPLSFSVSVTVEVGLALSTPVSTLLHPGTQHQPIYLPPAEAWYSPVTPPTEREQDSDLACSLISSPRSPHSPGAASRPCCPPAMVAPGLSLCTLGSSLGPSSRSMRPGRVLPPRFLFPHLLVPALQKERALRVSVTRPVPGPSLETEKLFHSLRRNHRLLKYLTLQTT